MDPRAPRLRTRCGSEAYTTPELVTAGRGYDARATDAWACGVVLFAVCVRRLPFGDGVDADAGEGTGIRGEPGSLGRQGYGYSEAQRAEGEMMEGKGGWAERRRIARGEYEWPSVLVLGRGWRDRTGGNRRAGEPEWGAGMGTGDGECRFSFNLNAAAFRPMTPGQFKCWPIPLDQLLPCW